LFGEADLSRDMVMPGAFRASIEKRGAAGIRMLFQHDPGAPIGVWEEVKEDARGLFVRGRLTTGVLKAREVLALMRAGAIDGLSIGFRTVRGRTDAKTGVRRLLEVDLWEISVVTFPLLPAARVESVKGTTLVRAIREAAKRMKG
jgi:HK97 family phage prohead protease